MKIKSKITYLIVCLLLSQFSFASSEETSSATSEKPSPKYGSKGKPIELDLASNSQITFNSANETKVYIKVKHMLPSRYGSYTTKISSKTLTPSSFTKPAVTEPGVSLSDQLGRDKPDEVQDVCQKPQKEFKEISEAIDTLAKESELPNKLEELNQSYNIVKYKCSDVIIEETTKIFNALKQKTTETYYVAVQPNMEYIVSVNYGATELSKLTISDPPTEWLTHVGMTFFENKDKFFYSKKVTTEITDETTMETSEEVTYQVARGADRGGFDQAATAIFTYPLSGDEIAFGLSTGLGTTKDTITALFGGSVIINHNFIITLGVIATQFDVLDSNYTVGDTVEEPTDSTKLTKTTVKFAPMLTLSYKFGS